MWVTGVSMELLETGREKRCQHVGKTYFLFHVLSCFIHAVFNGGIPGYPYIHARERKKGGQLKRLKSYTDIWNVEHVLYGLNDLKLPFPVTYSQIAWFVLSLMAVLFLDKYPPVCMINNELLKYVVIPVLTAWFMSRKTFDGKKPHRFFMSVAGYVFRPKETCCGKKVTYRKKVYDEKITIVRCYKHVSD